MSTSSRPRRVRASCCGSRDSAVTFAALRGVSPVEASSGKAQRRRLNRGGDRQANCALYTIVLARFGWDAHTRAYLEVTEGKTRREAIRCLKRYVAREMYQTIIIPRKNVLTPASTG
ncbi:transposase [Streptomyces sp. NPDC005506]|uniref:transposase n=1 Tax=unclassified Streptomyces TaxID=2593676 RepID=UPI003683C2A7